MGADSGGVSSLQVYISVHSPVDYVSFDFLHKVDCHQLGWFFFFCLFLSAAVYHSLSVLCVTYPPSFREVWIL